MRNKTLYISLLVVICVAPVTAQTWSYRQPAPVGFHRHVAGTGTDPAGIQRVYVIGGIDFTTASATVHGYNPVNNTWSSVVGY